MEYLHRSFIEAGFRVFPIWPIDPSTNNCTCGNTYCMGAGKHPRAINWPNTPIWDDEQLEALEKYSNLADGYGVICKDHLVIDIDARNGGIESYRNLLNDIPEILSAGLIVETGSGGGSKHLYFHLPEPIALVTSLPKYKGIDFKSSGFVVGPGSLHVSGRRYQAVDGTPHDIDLAPQALIDLLRKPERHRTEYNGISVDVSHDDIRDMLRYIPNNDFPYDEWLKIGMAIHQATNGSGFALWEEWSETSAKHDITLMEMRWHSFGRAANPVTIGTLIFHAEQNDWFMPVTFTPEREFDLPPVEVMPDGLPFDITGCDLTSPPGFVGEVARWIESNSRRPRLHLATATALVAIGNISGLFYIEGGEGRGSVSNLLCFCVAGSGTGKESSQKCLTEIHKVAGLAAATHGSIKSDQEITRNLIRHQAALYSIDEVGIFLTKIKNAQQRGGASYLETVIGTIMSVYSKSNASYILTGDGKEEIRKQLLNELAAHQRKLDDGSANQFTETRIKSLEKQLEYVDEGLNKPFLSLIGFTTPVTFDNIVTYESATNGFFGRALMFNERDTAPRKKPNFRFHDMPAGMEATIRRIASAGSFDITTAKGRIENNNERIEIPSDSKANQMLADADQWFDDRAQDHRAISGLESLYLRAYELVAKISFILSVPEGLRTAEHVRWAFALVKRDIEEKSRLVTANDREKDSPGVALHAKICNLCSGEEGETLGVIANNLRRYKREEIEKVVDQMVARGTLSKIETKHPRNGKIFVRLKHIGE